MRTKQDVNVIAHHHKRTQIVKLQIQTPAQRGDDQARNLRLLQKRRPQPSGVQIAVDPRKSFSG